MKMDAGLDTGPMLKKGVLLVEDDATFGVIHDAMAKLGGDLLIDVLDQLDTITPEIQDESLATYAHKVTKEDAKINNAMPVQKVLNIIRTFGGNWGGRFMYKGETLAIHSAIVVNCVVPEDRAASCPGPQETSHAKKEHSICSVHLFSTPKEPNVPDKLSAFRDDTILLMKDETGRLLFPCADGTIEIESIQRSGKRIMTTKEFLNGFKI
jgi:methionyl-tRNA formyltransferase